jgi:hypothetical protein
MKGTIPITDYDRIETTTECEIKFRINMAKAAFNRKKTLFTSKVYFNFRKKVVMCYTLNIALYGAKTWTLESRSERPEKVFKCGAGEGWGVLVGPIV